METALIEKALDNFVKALPEKPEWILVVDRSGKFIARIGRYPFKYMSQISDEIATHWTHIHGMNELETLDKLNHGNWQYSMSFGSDSTLFLFNLNDTFFMGMSYDGVQSFDAIIEGFRRSFGIVMEALYPD